LHNMSDDDFCDDEWSCTHYRPRRGTEHTTRHSNHVFMDLLRSMGVGDALINNSPRGMLSALINICGPSIYKVVKKYPRLAAMANIPVVLWFLSKYVTCNLEKIWKWLMS
jgi:hypothetical protein